MTAAKIQPMFFDDEDDSDLQIHFDPRDLEPIASYPGNLDDEYRQAQDQLRNLRQQEEQIRRQAAELEELTEREQAFKAGRSEVTKSLNETLAGLAEQGNEAQRLADTCAAAHERIESHLATIASLRPEMWKRADRKNELGRALATIDAAQEELDRTRKTSHVSPKKQSILGGVFSNRLPQSHQGADFTYWFRSGFAFSLPLIAFGIMAALVIWVF
jgi:chromosome segregation ATPase